MQLATIQTLEEKLASASDVDANLITEAADMVRTVFSRTPAHADVLGNPTDAVVHLVNKTLPGWTISLHGKATEPDGHWVCTLRDTGGRDNDAVIGFGSAPTVALALLSALVKVAAQSAKV